MKNLGLPSAMCLVVLAVAASPATAQTPPDLIDLIGARGSSGETAVTARGYVFDHTMQTGGSAYSYWTRHGACIQITTTDGRYVSIDKMDSTLCPTLARRGASSGCPVDVSEADRYKYPACNAGAPSAAGGKRRTNTCPPDVSQADRYKYPGCK